MKLLKLSCLFMELLI